MSTIPASRTPRTMRQPQHFDAAVVGAGFAGLYMLHRLRALGLSVRVYEAGQGVGGTWYWNRYPGARCDVESVDYAYSFSHELATQWQWSERYPAQPEILRYLNHVADRFDLRRDIQLDTRVTDAVYDDTMGQWNVETAAGERVTARFCIMATGCLSTWRVPALPGADTFTGATYHTGAWPHDGVDFTGKRVGVIGTGSSGIQCIPPIAAQAEHLYVFQRTATFSIAANNGPFTPDGSLEDEQTFAARRRQRRESPFGLRHGLAGRRATEVDAATRAQEFAARWQAGGLAFVSSFDDVLLDRRANDFAADFVRDRIREKVADPAVAEALCAMDFPLGAKRPCLDTGYFETFNRDNVTLVDLKRAPIDGLTPGGLQAGGQGYELDALVYATGFDAMTGALAKMNIRGTKGAALAQKWEAGPRAYLGLMMAGFPNLFTITGPGSPSVLSNMVVSIEQHVEWIADCIAHLQACDLAHIEPTLEAEQGWTDHVNAVAHMTLYPTANSWYMGANIPGKPRVFMPYAGGVGAYRAQCTQIAAEGYRGFTLTPPLCHAAPSARAARVEAAR